MGPGLIGSANRHFLPLAALLVFAGYTAAADKDFPNELNSDVEEPKIAIHETTEKLPVRSISSTTIKTDDPLIKLVWETREAQRRRLLSTSDHTPWVIMHGMLALREDFIIRHNGQVISGIEWISTGPTYRNEYWFEKTKFGGRAHPYSVPYAFEGHINQFLAILSMGGLPLEHEFRTPNGPITMRDMLRNAQMTATEREETTWTLWALSRYLPSDARWKNAKGEDWSIERLVRMEIDRPLQGAPCGGTHNLFALAHARNLHVRSGKPLRGVWLEAEQKIRKYVQQARMQQNSNGTLSSNFFRGREYKTDFDKRMASAGHILEFLMMSVTQEELSEPWIRKAIEATCNDLMANRKEYVSPSPLYHTVNALSVYLERVAPKETPQVAEEPARTQTISKSKDVAGTSAPAVAPIIKDAQNTTPGPISSDAPALKPVPVTEEKSKSPTDTEALSPTLEIPPVKAEEPAPSAQPQPEQPQTEQPQQPEQKPTTPPVSFVMLNSGPALLLLPVDSTLPPNTTSAPEPTITALPSKVSPESSSKAGAEAVFQVISSSVSIIVRAATATQETPDPNAVQLKPTPRWKATPKEKRTKEAQAPASPRTPIIQ